ncbi:MAG TPA: hypothetical protein VGW39_01800 [Chthoniobacterales bacterium]|nr:hypothetical protein [Chthoniobacterales bacterium]
MRRSSIVLLLVLLLFAHAAGAKPISQKELAEFLGPVSPRKIEWTKTVGSDFDAYSGRAMPPLAGTVNIYIGGWPHFKRSAGSTTAAGRLGPFPVTWHRKVAPNGTISQEAVLTLHGFWKVNVWLEAKRQSDIDGMIAIISKLPTFTQKPKPVSAQ